MGVLHEIRKETPFLRIGVAAIVTVVLLSLPLAATTNLGGAAGLFGGGFVVVYFVGGWMYDQLRNQSGGGADAEIDG